MPQIHVLDQQTIDKIAAGEVVERPSSVVKELVENAIDAHASAITVEIKEGGKSFIRITDNGCGMEKDQVKTAFLSHATSKISSVEDLMTVSSLGFRGEALSSIAAVSQVELITKTQSALTGVRYLINGGKGEEPEEIGAPEGTTFLVRNLFYNTPARQKFLKTATTEAGYISTLLERLSLSHPDISFKFINNGQTKLQTSGNGKMRDLIYQIYGRDIAANVIQVAYQQDHVSFHGFIGKPIISRGNRNFENYYINQRYIKSNLIAKGIEEAYRSFMMQHQYPFTVLYFDIDKNYVDVNVHPTKMEMRFSNEEAIYQGIVIGLRNALMQRELIPEVSLTENEKKKEEKNLKPIPEPFEKNRRRELEAQNERVNAEKKKEFLQQNAAKTGGTFATQAEKFVQKEPERPFHRNTGTKNQLHKHVESELPLQNHLQKNTEPESRLYQKEETQKQLQNALETGKQLQKETEPAAQQKSENEKTVSQDVQPKVYDKKDLHQMTLAETIDYTDNSNGSNTEKAAETKKLLEPKNRKYHRIIGQYLDTYWLVEFDEKLFIIDQHAAHEKVLYERTMKSFATREFTSQNLCPPIVVTLSMQEENLLQQYLPEFERLGFVIEHFGGREYAISAVPDNLFGLNGQQLLLDILDGLTEITGTETSDMIRNRVATMSCKAAVKGNNHLSYQEAEALIDELLTLENPYHCPHGRPTIISMTKGEIERKFKRIV